MTSKDEILIFTDISCDPCALLKNLLKDRDDIRFLDISEPEALPYIQGDEAIVPVAFTKGKFYAVEGGEEGIALKSPDEDEKIPLCHMKKEGNKYLIDCGQGYRDMDEVERKLNPPD